MPRQPRRMRSASSPVTASISSRTLASAASSAAVRAAGVERRVEARGEQAEQGPRDGRVREERVGHVVHAVGVAELARVAGVGPQHRDLPPRQAGAQHQRAEPVGLRLAPPRRRERRGELGGDLGLRPVGQRGVGGDVHPQPEVVGPAAQAVRSHDLRRPLVQHVHPEPLQQRQHGGQRRRRTGQVEGEPLLLAAGRGVEPQPEVPGAPQPCDVAQVHQCLGRVDPRLVGLRHAVQQLGHVLAAGQRQQAVVPRADGLGELVLQGLDVDGLGRRRPAGRGPGAR